MDTYSLLRAFADSWFLAAMFAFLIGAWIFAFWPGLKGARDDAAQIPFRGDVPECTKDCANCACKTDFLKEAQNG